MNTTKSYLSSVLLFASLLTLFLILPFYLNYEDEFIKKKKHETPKFRNNFQTSMRYKRRRQDGETNICDNGRHFAYIRTHKTGSTTVHSVFNAYKTRHSMNAAFPRHFPCQAGYPSHIKKEFIYFKKNNSFISVDDVVDFVIMNHFRFNYTELKRIMPKDTAFVSVIRSPWKHFQSAFNFYYRKPFSPKQLRHNCFKYPFFHVAEGRCINITDYLRLASRRLNSSVPWFFRSKNYQSHDLGLDPLLDDDDDIKAAVEKLGTQLDFVMITDYMDESLILLKELFCMSWMDLLAPTNKKGHIYISYNYEDDAEIKNIFDNMYKLDFQLYNYFNKTFWKKVHAYGRDRMREDVKKLRKMRSLLTSESAYKSKQAETPFTCDKDKEQETKSLFKKIKDNTGYKAMNKILKKKLSNFDSQFSSQQVEMLAKSMLNNYGGCPA